MNRWEDLTKFHWKPPPDDDERQCKKCRRTKHITDFYEYKVERGQGRYHTCKECRIKQVIESSMKEGDIQRQKPHSPED